MSPVSAKERARIIGHWAAVLDELYLLQNIHSMLAVYHGLKMQPVQLLKSVWSHVAKPALKSIETVCLNALSTLLR